MNYNLFQKYALLAIFAISLMSCSGPKETDDTMEQEASQEISYQTDDAKSIIKAIEMACGSWNKLWEQKDVEFTYSYKYPQEGKEDVSVERYVFDTEQSWAKYSKHEINVMPDAEGEVIQYYDGSSAYIKHGEEMIDNPEAIGGSQFLRKANYHWFVMMYKMGNPGANYEYMGSEPQNGVEYDKVKVTYDSTVTGKDQNDTFILYVNPETKMVDQFYFSLPFLGVNEPVIFMKLEYEEVNGLMIASKRSIFMPSENGYSEEPNLVQTTTGIKFNNGFTADSFAM